MSVSVASGRTGMTTAEEQNNRVRLLTQAWMALLGAKSRHAEAVRKELALAIDAPHLRLEMEPHLRLGSAAGSQRKGE